jgi:hypothetical protein
MRQKAFITCVKQSTMNCSSTKDLACTAKRSNRPFYAPFTSLQQAVKRVLQRTGKKTLEDYKGEPDIVQAEELLALLSEEDLTFWQSPKLSKILYAFRRILKRLGIISNKLTKDDLIEEIHN